MFTFHLTTHTPDCNISEDFSCSKRDYDTMYENIICSIERMAIECYDTADDCEGDERTAYLNSKWDLFIVNDRTGDVVEDTRFTMYNF